MKRIAAAMLGILLLLSASALAEGSFSADPDAMEAAAKSVLMLEVYDRNDTLIGSGSGFVAYDNSTIVTNYHVIDGVSRISAKSDDGDEYNVTAVLIADEEKDVAICGFESATDLAPLTLGEGENLKRGAAVVAIGSPNGITNSVSIGNISAVYEEDNVSWVQFTAPISSGSSGGVLFDDAGSVIGVTTGTYNNTQNLNLAINISEVNALYANWDGSRMSLAEYAQTTAPVSQFGMEDVAPELLEKYSKLERGSSGEGVRQMQQKLIDLGYLTGSADGVFGAQTEKAVALFNRMNFIAADSGVASAYMQMVLLEREPVPYSDTAAVIGTWYIDRVSMEGISIAPSDMGLDIKLVINEDKTWEMEALGETESGTWKVDKNGNYVLSDSTNSAITISKEGAALFFEQEGGKFYFSQEQPQDTSFAPGDVVTDVKLEDFEGEWTLIRVGINGAYVQAKGLGLEWTVSISDGKATSDYSYDGDSHRETADVNLQDGELEVDDEYDDCFKLHESGCMSAASEGCTYYFEKQ